MGQGFHRVLFDAMPMPVFVVDPDVSMLEYNAAAVKLVGADKRAVVGRRAGDVLNCLHAAQAAEGCGHASVCEHCVVRRSVSAAFAGEHVSRQWARLDRLEEGKRTKVNLQVSCQRFTYHRHTFALLILEGLTD